MGVAALHSHAFEWLIGHVDDITVGVVVQQKNSMLPFSYFLLNSRLESFHLFNIEFHVDRLISFKQFVVDNPFPVPPYAHRFTPMKLFNAR